MKIKKLILGVPVLLCAALLISCAPAVTNVGVDKAENATARQAEPVAKGKVLGMSKKAKTITIKDKKLGNVMLKFDDATKGLEFAKKGEAAIVKFKMVGDDKVATVVKPKLAKLPTGVSEIMPKDLAGLIDGKNDFVLIDSRPGKPYAQGHIPGAISMPVSSFKEAAANLLPKDNKDKLLVFYCGGPT